MITRLLKNKNFAELSNQNAKNLLEFFLKERIDFSVLCSLSGVGFSPALPSEISKNLKPLTVFVLSNYSLENAHISNNSLLFEAGFGENNFGSLVSIPISHVIQIVVDDTIVFINLCASLHRNSKQQVSGIETSFNSLLNNPKNSSFK